MKVRFYGASDDLFLIACETESGEWADVEEIDCYGRPGIYSIRCENPSINMLVVGRYAPQGFELAGMDPGASWEVFPRFIGDGDKSQIEIPDVPMGFEVAHEYSAAFKIDLPGGAMVYAFQGFGTDGKTPSWRPVLGVIELNKAVS